MERGLLLDSLEKKILKNKMLLNNQLGFNQTPRN
jgi:hypothetical protein